MAMSLEFRTKALTIENMLLCWRSWAEEIKLLSKCIKNQNKKKQRRVKKCSLKISRIDSYYW